MSSSGGLTERSPRFTVTVFLTVGDEMVPFGRTRDLSATGAFVETAARPEIGSTQELAIVWGEDTLVFAARVVRHAGDGIGVTFVDPSDGFQRAVVEILQSAPQKPSLPHS